MGRDFSRRRWLRGTGSALVGASFADLLSACASWRGAQAGGAAAASSTGVGSASSIGPEPGASSELPALPAERRVGFALVGLGKLTLDELLPAFAYCKFAKVTALVSGDRAKAERVGRQYGIAPAQLYDYAGFDRIRDDRAIDVVYVVLPNSMHAEYTIRAAQAGKHVLCEKPMANSVEECRQMIAACARAQKQLMIAYRMQYEPLHRELIRMVRSGELGRLKNILTSNGQMQKDPREWRLKRALAGGGPLPDIGIYCLNAARYLTGEEPTEIQALQFSTPGDPRFAEVEEQVNFTLRFPSGVLASCATSYSVHDSKQLRLLAEDGWLELDPGYSYRGLRLRMERTNREAGGEPRSVPSVPEQNQFALELDHMARCVREQRRPHTPGEEGMQDMRLIAAIYEAAQTGRTVKLPAMAGLDLFRGPAPA